MGYQNDHPTIDKELLRQLEKKTSKANKTPQKSIVEPKDHLNPKISTYDQLPKDQPKLKNKKTRKQGEQPKPSRPPSDETKQTFQSNWVIHTDPPTNEKKANYQKTRNRLEKHNNFKRITKQNKYSQ